VQLVKLFIVLFVLVPYCLLPLQPTCPQHTVLGCLSIYILTQCERPSFTPRCFLHYVMCVVFILEYSLLFFLQHKVWKQYTFFCTFVHHVCMSLFCLIMVARCSFLINGAMSCCQKWMVDWHVGHSWWKLSRMKLSSVPLLWMEVDGFHISFRSRTFG
jgi:hypothetical protein